MEEEIAKVFRGNDDRLLKGLKGPFLECRSGSPPESKSGQRLTMDLQKPVLTKSRPSPWTLLAASMSQAVPWEPQAMRILPR
jgi:hypothetical protein